MLTPIQYTEAVLRTLAPGTRNEHLAAAAIALGEELGEMMGQVYGIHEPDIPKLVDETGDLLWYLTVICHEGSLSLERILEQARRVGPLPENSRMLGNLAQLAIPMAVISGLVKKYLFHGHELPLVPLEAALVETFRAFLTWCNVLLMSVKEIMALNIAKLEARYPEGFSPERSQNRV